MLFCFSQEEPHWNSIVKDGKRIFEPGGYISKDRKDCIVSAFPTDDGKVRVNVRTKKLQYSMYMKKNIEIKFLYSFNISSIEEPIVEKCDRNSCYSNEAGQEMRWAIHLRKEGNEHRERRDCSIWQWALEGDIRQSEIFRLFEDIKEKFNSPNQIMNMDDIETEFTDNTIVPVIVQPSTDGWKNFVRQVHCVKLDDSQYEVTLVFNDEHLRKHGALESFYRFLRPYLYGRLTDLESFKVILEGNATTSHYVFPGIYSGKSEITEDSIHGDKEWFFLKAPKRRTRYYYSDRMHPVVFINTANHALGEDDNNGTLWKWEFVPWEHDSPIVHGNKSRKDIEELVKNLDEKETTKKIVNNLRQQNITEEGLRDEKERKQQVDHIRREYIVNKTTAERLLHKAIAQLKEDNNRG